MKKILIKKETAASSHRERLLKGCRLRVSRPWEQVLPEELELLWVVYLLVGLCSAVAIPFHCPQHLVNVLEMPPTSAPPTGQVMCS